MKKVEIKNKVVARGGGKEVKTSADTGADLSGVLMKSVWDEAFSIRETEDGEKYLQGKLPMALENGMATYVDADNPDLPGIYDGLPIDNSSIYWQEVTQADGKKTRILKSKANDVDLTELDKKYATKTELEDVEQVVGNAEETAETAKVIAESAVGIANEANRKAITAKNAISTLQGLANATEAQKTLAGQVMQIEENKQNIGAISVDLDNITERNYCLGASGWYYDSSSKYGKHKAIYVKGYVKVDITCGNTGQYIGFMTSEYVPPTSASVPPFSEDIPYRIWQYENTTTAYEIPEDCEYLILGTQDGGGNVGSYEEVVLYSKNGLSGQMNEAKVCKFEHVNLEDIESVKCSLSSKWYYEMGYGVHKAVPLKGYKRVQIKATGANGGGWIGFVTSSYRTPSNGMTIPFSYRYPNRIWVYEGDAVTYDLCPDIEYLIICVMDGGGNQPKFDVWVEYEEQISTQPVLTQLIQKVDELKRDSMVGSPVSVDISGLKETNGVIGSIGWYIDNAYGSRHKAIPVRGGTSISIRIEGENGTYIGFLTDSYSPPYNTNDHIPYCKDVQYRIWQYGNTKETYNIPSDCVYVVVSVVDGGGKIISYGDVTIYGYEGASVPLHEFVNEVRNGGGTSGMSGLARMRVMAWNIGHYCYGTGTQSAVDNTNYLEQRTAYRTIFNEQGADLVGLVEYSDVFNTSTGESAAKAILSQYANKFFGDVNASGYVCNGIVTNVKITEIAQISLPNNYYAIEGKAGYMGSEFKVCVAHLPWQTEQMNVESAQILIDRYVNDRKVIVMGDFNIYDTSLYDMFANAGYDLGNHGYMGDIVTRPQTGTFLDNIVVKGGRIVKTVVPMTELSDHLPVVCDIVI